MSKIFISYRRADSAGHVGRLYDRLTDHFGAAAVFMDINVIEPGVNFVKVVDAAIRQCHAVIVVIGPQWLTIRDDEGQRRLDNPNDLVRLEVATALNHDIRLIPALVGGASMPREFELPDALKQLVVRNAIEITDTYFHQDADRLIAVLEKVVDTSEIPQNGGQFAFPTTFDQTDAKLKRESWSEVAILRQRADQILNLTSAYMGFIGILFLVSGFLLVNSPTFWSDTNTFKSSITARYVVVGVFFVMAVASLIVTYGLLRRRAWAWTATVAFNGIWVIVTSCTIIFPLISGVIIYYFISNPGVKYALGQKTSPSHSMT